jgi:hypothetical protein
VLDAATDVINEVLAAGKPSALAILNALDDAGYVLLPPAERRSPKWMPTTASGMDKVRRCAEVINSGKSTDEAASELRLAVRTIERHAAAARAFGLLKDRRRK